MELDSVAVVLAWQDAVSGQDVDRVLEFSAMDVEVRGPRGSGYGHQVLREWLAGTRLNLETQRIFARDETVVVAQHGIWRSPETREVIGESDVASLFKVEMGKVTKYARYDELGMALNETGLMYADEVTEQRLDVLLATIASKPKENDHEPEQH